MFKVDYAWQNGYIRKSKVCTSLPNQWIAPQLSTITPMEAADMVFEKPAYTKKKRPVKDGIVSRRLFTPLTKSHDNSPSLDELTNAFFDSCSTSAAFQYSMPFSQSSVSPDDDLNVGADEVVMTGAEIPTPIPELAQVHEDPCTFLKSLPTLSADEIQCLEEETREQSESAAWINHRKGRITASIAHQVLSKVRRGEIHDRNNSLVNSILGLNPPDPNLPALKYGRQTEPEAVQAYVTFMKRKHHNFRVSKSGLVVVRDQIYMAVSPDRLVECDCCGCGLLEVKCPFSAAGELIASSEIKCLEKSTQKLKKNHSYYAQVQMQMGATDRSWCDFMVYTRADFIIDRIQFDHDLWTELRTACKTFFEEVIAAKLCGTEGRLLLIS